MSNHVDCILPVAWDNPFLKSHFFFGLKKIYYVTFDSYTFDKFYSFEFYLSKIIHC